MRRNAAALLALLPLLAAVSAAAQTVARDPDSFDLWAAIRFEWGQYAAGHPAEVTVLRADVTCDGNPDFVAARIDLDDPEGPSFDLLVVSRWSAPARRGIDASIPFAGAGREGLAGDPVRGPRPQLRLDTFTAAQLRALTDRPACPVAIVVDDGQTDAFRFFWLPGPTPADEPALLLLRN